MRHLLPLFLDLAGREVVLVGGGRVANAKLRQLLDARARVTVVSPAITTDIDQLAERHSVSSDGATAGIAATVTIVKRAFVATDLDGAWLVVAAATPDVNRLVAEAANERRLFVNAVDDPANATAYLSGVVRRDEVTIAISTNGGAPALTALVREALDRVLPKDLSRWMQVARTQRTAWRRTGVPMDARKPLLLRALNDLYAGLPDDGRTPRIPWLSGPEDSWL
ncbi:MAG TPA: bifunctional precorrin-2 dehydrogenase/sirohydrochlorin ferrochelatase [Vicinamibacterales bacterium]|jgi:uroporphyrin-III C-methyltransferase/precorrin-2 dehydrogenase/sirohydrochlorin ferrochelatase